ncbi:22702_t:CDS:2, partial [Racocetra persica]
MTFEKLFKKSRKTEATSLFIFKSSVSILLLIALLGYTWLIIWGIYNDNPVIQNSLQEENYIPVPGFVYGSEQNMRISCHFVNASGIQDCNRYIKYSIRNTLGKNSIEGLFTTRDLKFSAVPNNGISSLEFKIYLNDTRNNISANFSPAFTLPYIIFTMLDGDYLKSSKEFQNSDLVQNQLSTYSKFPNTITTLNLYQLAALSSYKFKIKRKRKELMLPSWENYLGFSSKLLSIPYFTSNLETSPLLNDTEFPTLILLAKVTIEPQSFITQVETEKRFFIKFIESGAWGFAATIYAILFGTIGIKPWGLAQKYGFKINKSVQTKLQNTLEFIPFINHPKTTDNLNNHELKRRLDSLQLFLTEYVVDVQYLEKIYKANINEK